MSRRLTSRKTLPTPARQLTRPTTRNAEDDDSSGSGGPWQLLGMLPAVGQPPARPDDAPAAGPPAASSAWPCCCAPRMSQSAWSPTAAGGPWCGRRAAARPARRSGTPACSARIRRRCRHWSRCCSRFRFLAVRDRRPAARAAGREPGTPGGSHRDPRPPGPRRSRDARSARWTGSTASPAASCSPGSMTTTCTPACVTVMMRVVFLLFAEERRLLPSDDDIYVAAYSVGHLVGPARASRPAWPASRPWSTAPAPGTGCSP